MTFHAPESMRDTDRSTAVNGNNGLFLIRSPIGGRILRVICSDGMGWEHVSVSLPTATPTWVEMCTIKDLWWDAEDAVMQLHPPQSAYINHHPYCLHLWRPTRADIPQPPYWMVGPKPGQSEADARAEAETAILADQGRTP